MHVNPSIYVYISSGYHRIHIYTYTRALVFSACLRNHIHTLQRNHIHTHVSAATHTRQLLLCCRYNPYLQAKGRIDQVRALQLQQRCVVTLACTCCIVAADGAVLNCYTLPYNTCVTFHRTTHVLHFTTCVTLYRTTHASRCISVILLHFTIQHMCHTLPHNTCITLHQRYIVTLYHTTHVLHFTAQHMCYTLPHNTCVTLQQLRSLGHSTDKVGGHVRTPRLHPDITTRNP